MNANRRFTAIVTNLGLDGEMHDSSTGTHIVLWRNMSGFYFVALANDIDARMGFTTRHETVESVVKAAMDLVK